MRGGASRTRRVRVLSDDVASQIAAGEVVERPASVVKELVENALDAGASRIRVELAGGGKQRIRVSDDGLGMSREDALLALDRHATSKIVEAADLVGVRTFGFRGEALPSILSVSDFVLETSDGSEDPGTRILGRAGRIVDVADTARQRGTTVEVRRLFFNAPARAKFLKPVAAETRAVVELLAPLVLAHPPVALQLISGERTLIDAPSATDLGPRLGALWGNDVLDELIPVHGRAGEMEAWGLVQRPDKAGPGFRRVQLFVNGRPVRDARLLRAADRAYTTTVPSRARPWLFLFLRVPGDRVDVNVHPAKLEVRFRDAGPVETLIEETVRSALTTEESAAPLGGRPARAPLAVREPPPRRPAPGDAPPPDQMALFLAGDPGPSEPATAGSPRARSAPPSGHVWQALDTYIFVATRDEVLIIDQHSAHERVLFERLMNAFGAGGETAQRLLFPLTLRLTPAEVEQVLSLAGLFERAGFQVEPFGTDTVIVHAVPDPHPWFDAERCFREMVRELTEGSELVRSARNQHERIAMTFACKGAIKAGQRLDQREMQALVDQLFATELPHHDVHGRPTVVRLSAAELGRRFARG